MAIRKRHNEPKPQSKTKEYEQALAAPVTQEHYVLRLYISGTTIRSLRALEHIKAICERYLAGRYDLEVIDVYQHPLSVMADQVVAAPTLVKQLPLPVRTMIGDLSNQERLLLGLNLP